MILKISYRKGNISQVDYVRTMMSEQQLSDYYLKIEKVQDIYSCKIPDSYELEKPSVTITRLNNEVKLEKVSNPELKEYIGRKGIICPNSKGGIDFRMDIGKTISTSSVREDTVLGNLTHPACKELSFETSSGSQYCFETNIDRERIVDGCFKKDNQFLGFEKEYK